MFKATHGLRRTTEYNCWAHMIQRCTNPRNKAWKNYGGRGISIYPPWRRDFLSFFAYMGKKPSRDLSIERIDNDGNYEPGNVKWGTDSEQAKNRRPFKIAKKKTHCPAGHPYDDTNTWVMPNGVRRCKACINARARNYRASNPQTRSNISRSRRPAL